MSTKAELVTSIDEVFKPLSQSDSNTTVTLQTVLDRLDSVSDPHAWETLERKLAITSTGGLEFNGEADSFDTNTSPTTTTTTTSTTTVLKVKITDQDKEALHASFEKLDSSKFWMLQATKMEAERQGSRAESVKEKAMSFTFPSMSLILDITDDNWQSEFSEDELEEVSLKGGPLEECKVPEELASTFNELKEMKSPLEVFMYARRMPLNPCDDSLKVWLSTELQNVLRPFLKKKTLDITSIPEADQLYKFLGFFATIFEDTLITAKGSEKSSESSGNGKNAK
ncbi:hypothetical protein BDB00DRAFT_874713 [Zychaea mexicana]|uniref:uncharacterized protein n=1 Tax=Zychaea mexicana TaxID=64656 RepID=UPI0022FDC439|nr:uncharacterized protein BDB00DRAFT_874713 [Zychaea mexicana]KAI9491023.1 hypothetical protein BDB00DRAFT_874713 [Zychaea mexicana]